MPIIFGLVVVFLEMYLKKMNEGLCSLAQRLCCTEALSVYQRNGTSLEKSNRVHDSDSALITWNAL